MWHQEIAISMGSNLQLWIFEMNFEYPKGRRLKPQVGILYPFRTPDSLIVSQKKWSLLNLIYVYSICNFESPDSLQILSRYRYLKLILIRREVLEICSFENALF